MMKKIFLLLSFALTAIASWAVKAYPEPVVITQSDGTKLTVVAHGDEDFHWFTTTDGVLLVQQENAFYIAEIDESGNVMASQQLAHDQHERSASEQQLVRAQHPRRDAFFHKATNKRQKAMQQRISIGTAKPSYFPHMGEPRAMVILVQFSDTTFVSSNPKRIFTRYLNEEGVQPNYGSVLQYFNDMSGGLFRPQFDLFGPVTLPKPSAYYGKDQGTTKDVNLNEMIKSACESIDDTVDFSPYDADKDGYVDLVYIIYAGYSQSITGNSSDCIWPKSGTISGGTYDGVTVSRYGVNNELNLTPTYKYGKIVNGIGLFCHEFSHTMGLPDVYPTTAAAQAVDNQALEYWDLMDAGEYTNTGYTPTPYTPWEKEVMGWTEIEELTEEAQITLPEDKFYRINSDTNDEYLILQNLQNTGWASGIIGQDDLQCHGLLVYRIDYSNASGTPFTSVNLGDYPNNTAGKPGITLAPADGLIISSYRTYGSDEAKKTADKPYSTAEYRYSHTGDPYPGSQNVTQLLSVQMNRCTIEKPLYNIKENDGIITFDFLKDITTLGIENAATEPAESGEIYDLQGRRMSETTLRKGIYMKKGRKFVVR